MYEKTRPLDLNVRIVTPENIAFAYRVAGPFRRLPAWLLDIAIRSTVIGITMLVLGMSFSTIGIGGLGFGLGLAAWFALSWFYGGLFETFWNGQTPGKKAMGIRVVSIDGQPISAWQAILRNVAREIDMQPFPTFLIGLGVAMSNQRFQRLGDLVCGTMVVVEEPRWSDTITRVDDPGALALIPHIPRGFQPSPSLARALALYVSRREVLQPNRRVEVASRLARLFAERWGMPINTDPDQLLVALYAHTFLDEDISRQAASVEVPAIEMSPAVNPFATGGAPQ